MAEFVCCEKRNWALERDLGHAHSFDFILGKCSSCGGYSMNVFCTANGISGFEALSPQDLSQIRSMPSGQELKEFLKDWGYGNL
jgi:hypothetical protein